MKIKPRIIAYYLPQFHPIPENDLWWGKGFTEWTNVSKAKPLFKGHYQPNIPADLGFYDLRLPEVRVAQAQLAREAGIEGFCYWHYWFGDHRTLLESPLNEVVKLGEPDFPICLGWANESWYSKIWNSDGAGDKLLIEQLYLGEKDNYNHFMHLLPVFKDQRYIKVDGKLLFVIYRPFLFEHISDFISQWRSLAKEYNLGDFYFVGQINDFADESKLIKLGFDAVTVSPAVRMKTIYNNRSKFFRGISRLIQAIRKRPLVLSYNDASKYFVNVNEDSHEHVIPSIIPRWDHSPRSGKNALVLHNSNINSFARHIRDVFKVLRNKPTENQLVFLKSWNEWGEGNYMEPDLRSGNEYIKTLRNEIDTINRMDK